MSIQSVGNQLGIKFPLKYIWSMLEHPEFVPGGPLLIIIQRHEH